MLSKDRFNSPTTSQCFVVHEPQRKGRREWEIERGLTNRLVVKETNWSHQDLHFLHWKALLNHLATDTVFPQRVSAHRANSCYANGPENNICRSESHLQQESAPFLLLLWRHQCEGWAALWAWGPVFFYLQGVLHRKVQLLPSWSQSCQQVTQIMSNGPLNLSQGTNTIIGVDDVSFIFFCAVIFPIPVDAWPKHLSTSHHTCNVCLFWYRFPPLRFLSSTSLNCRKFFRVV